MLRTLCVLIVSSLLASCALVDVREITRYEQGGQSPPEATIDNLVSGTTTKRWVLENLGKPDNISPYKNSTEIFTYRYVESKAERVRIALLFKFENRKEHDKHIFVQIGDGLVINYWRDYELPLVAEDSFRGAPKLEAFVVPDLPKEQEQGEALTTLTSKIKAAFKKSAPRKKPH
jgi:hypothetical protein